MTLQVCTEIKLKLLKPNYSELLLSLHSVLLYFSFEGDQWKSLIIRWWRRVYFVTSMAGIVFKMASRDHAVEMNVICRQWCRRRVGRLLGGPARRTTKRVL